MLTRATVMKFGGTSVEDARAFERVARIVQTRENVRPVVVVSAMSRVTDALLKSVEAAAAGDGGRAFVVLGDHFERHLDVARSLLDAGELASFEAVLERAKREIRDLLQKVAAHLMSNSLLQDVIVSYGERLSAALLASVLRANDLPSGYVDARRLIVTDESHGCATPLLEETEKKTRAELEPLIEAGKIPVLGGFIAASKTGETTTLGRGGSDYTAALVGASLFAREIEIWTDVAGVLTADPRIVAEARTVASLSYKEAAELAYFGAKVLHPKTIQPAVERAIPVRVCNSRRPEEDGTLICFDTEMPPRTVKAIAHKTGITVVQVTSARMLGAYGFLRTLFEVFDRHRAVVDVVATSEVSVSLTVDDPRALAKILPELRRLGSVEVKPRSAIISVIGEGLLNTPGVAACVFSAIGDINVSLVSVGASSVNLTFVVDEERAGEAVRRLHRAYFEQNLMDGAAAVDSARELKEAVC